MLSSKNTYEIVVLKGIFSGLGSVLTAFVIGESMPHLVPILLTMALGFVAYGLSIFVYIKAQNVLGAAKTSAFYALAPFLASGISYVVLKEPFSQTFGLALAVMILGTIFAVADSFSASHSHRVRIPIEGEKATSRACAREVEKEPINQQNPRDHPCRK